MAETPPVPVNGWLDSLTDGVTELCNERGEMLGSRLFQHGLAAICQSARAQGAEEIAQRVGTWLDDFRGDAPAEDDRTLLVAGRRAPAPA